MQRLRVLRHQVERRPLVWWHVEGRRAFAMPWISKAVRDAWSVGNYQQ